MNKITDQTTLGELAMLRAQFGVTSLTLMFAGGRVFAGLRTSTIDAYGTGDTEPDALNAAFDHLRTQLIERYSQVPS